MDEQKTDRANDPTEEIASLLAGQEGRAATLENVRARLHARDRASSIREAREEHAAPGLEEAAVTARHPARLRRTVISGLAIVVAGFTILGAFATLRLNARHPSGYHPGGATSDGSPRPAAPVVVARRPPQHPVEQMTLDDEPPVEIAPQIAQAPPVEPKPTAAKPAPLVVRAPAAGEHHRESSDRNVADEVKDSDPAPTAQAEPPKGVQIKKEHGASTRGGESAAGLKSTFGRKLRSSGRRQPGNANHEASTAPVTVARPAERVAGRRNQRMERAELTPKARAARARSLLRRLRIAALTSDIAAPLSDLPPRHSQKRLPRAVHRVASAHVEPARPHRRVRSGPVTARLDSQPSRTDRFEIQPPDDIDGDPVSRPRRPDERRRPISVSVEPLGRPDFPTLPNGDIGDRRAATAHRSHAKSSEKPPRIRIYQKANSEDDRVRVRICLDSGDVANAWCPHTARLTVSRSNAPHRVCRMHGP